MIIRFNIPNGRMVAEAKEKKKNNRNPRSTSAASADRR